MQDLFPHESGALCLLSPSRNVVEASAVWGEPPTTQRVFSPDDCWALRRGQLHEAGDTVLRELSNCIQTLTREYDLACRYGGEEFTIILPDASLDVTVKRAEKLRDKFKHLSMQYQNRRLPAGTLSLGVAAFPEHGSTTEPVLRAADSALYQAKHEGRDRVVVAEAG